MSRLRVSDGTRVIAEVVVPTQREEFEMGRLARTCDPRYTLDTSAAVGFVLLGRMVAVFIVLWIILEALKR